MQKRIFDFGKWINGADSDKRKFASDLSCALVNDGCFHLFNHNIKPSLVKECFDLSPLLFSGSVKPKLTASSPTLRTGITCNEMVRGTATVKQNFDCVSPKITKEREQWPLDHVVPGFANAVSNIYGECEDLFAELICCLSMELDADQSLMQIHRTSNHTLSLMNYPRVSRSQEKMYRNPPHSDMGTLTLLIQDGTAGLEVAKETTKPWYGDFDAIDPDRKYVFVTAGYLLERWTRGKWPAVEHRVVTPEEGAIKERNSIAFFGAPDASTIMKAPGKSDVRVAEYQMKKRISMYS